MSTIPFSGLSIYREPLERCSSVLGADVLIPVFGNTSGTIPNKISNPYPSNLIQRGQHVFFATGVTNGFEPILFYFNLDKNEPVILKEFTQSSDNFTSIIPIGVVGSKLYYFSNLDTNYGRELYSIETGVKTSTNNISVIGENQYFAESTKNTCTIQRRDLNNELLEVEIFDLTGRLIKKINVNIGEYFDLPLHNQNLKKIYKYSK